MSMNNSKGVRDFTLRWSDLFTKGFGVKMSKVQPYFFFNLTWFITCPGHSVIGGGDKWVKCTCVVATVVFFSSDSSITPLTWKVKKPMERNSSIVWNVFVTKWKPSIIALHYGLCLHRPALLCKSTVWMKVHLSKTDTLQTSD